MHAVRLRRYVMKIDHVQKYANRTTSLLVLAWGVRRFDHWIILSNKNKRGLKKISIGFRIYNKLFPCPPKGSMAEVKIESQGMDVEMNSVL